MRQFRHVPIVEGGRPIGILSIGDIGKAVISDEQLFSRDPKSYNTSASA